MDSQGKKIQIRKKLQSYMNHRSSGYAGYFLRILVEVVGFLYIICARSCCFCSELLFMQV